MLQRAFGKVMPKGIIGSAVFVFCSMLVVSAVLPAVTAHAVNIAVTVTSDDNAINGNCTLREAVIAANNDGPVDACPAGAGDDVIILSAGTYMLTVGAAGNNAAGSGDLDIIQDVNIESVGANATIIQGTGDDRLLEIFPSTTVIISGVTLRGGNVPAIGTGQENNGGSIRNSGLLTLIGVAVDANNSEGSAGGIQNGGGGGSTAVLTIEDSTISNNRAAAAAGGIANAGGATLIIRNSTISGNAAPAAGGINSFGTVDLNNVTVANNSATAGMGGGIFVSGGTVTLSNTILGTNNATGNGDDCFGTLSSAGNNFLEDSGGCNGLTNGVGGNIVGGDLFLGSLQNNGGTTLTHRPSSDSPAVDGGNNSTCEATDQRGGTRARSSADPCDIGSVERSAVIASPTPTPSVSPTPTPVTCFGFTATITGTAGNNNITGTSGRDIIHGLAGNDIINGLGGNDVICGGSGNDMINGGIGNDRLIGQFGTDTISGGVGNDILDGRLGNDTLNGNQGNDSLTGLGGNDALDGGFGTDNCNGGPGTDTATACENVTNVP